MKKPFRLLAFMAIIASTAVICACDKSDNDNDSNGSTTNNASIIGSIWTTDYDKGYPEGWGLLFATSTKVHLLDWEYEHGDFVYDIEDSFTYSYEDPNGIIYVQTTTGSGTDASTMRFEAPFVIKNNTMTLTNPERQYVLTRHE
ncbi:MAG: hypothetical protein IJP80_04080 [Bacteroidales bacterium]|nr:hypothetical protein [Bacteroidales bacterium]